MNPSFRTTVFTVFFLSLSCFTWAQLSFPFSIAGIRGPTNLDLFDLYDPRSEKIVLDAGVGMCWDIFQSDGSEVPQAFYDAFATVELISGTEQAAGNNVVDIVGVGIGPDVVCVTYWPPTSLPLGQYHFRINSTVNTTIGTNNTIQHLTARGSTFNLTMSSPLGCGANRGNFATIPSPNASTFTSLFFVSPWDGEYFGRNSVFASWDYKNGFNSLNKGISNVTIQVVDNSNGSNVGAPRNVSQNELVESQPGVTLSSSDIGMKVNGTYKLRITYVNQFQDGQVSPGGLVTLLSGAFNIVDDNTNCTVLAASSNSNSSGSSGRGNGAPSSGVRGIISHLIGVFLLLVIGMTV